MKACPTCAAEAHESRFGAPCYNCLPEHRAANTFEREERYIVIKRKHLTPGEEKMLRDYIPDRSLVSAVVVEADWPEYEPVWSMLESRVSARAENERLREALDRVKAALARRSEPVMDPPYTAAFNAALDMVEVALLGDAKTVGGCTLGVGCEETGICYAKAHGKPEQCALSEQEGK